MFKNAKCDDCIHCGYERKCIFDLENAKDETNQRAFEISEVCYCDDFVLYEDD